MNIGQYYCVKTNKDGSGKIISCILRTNDGKFQIEKERDSLITEIKNNRISVINLEYSGEMGKLRVVPILKTETGRRAQSSVQSSLHKIASNLMTKSKGEIKSTFANLKIDITDGLIAGGAANFKNVKNGKVYQVFLYVGINGDYYIKDSVEGDYYESYSKKVDAERLIYKMAQSVLL